MTLSYLPRLICLALAGFSILYAGTSLVVALSARRAARFAESFVSARRAANFLFILRLLPFALAALFTLCVTIPSYILFEPDIDSEAVGVFWLMLTLPGLALTAVSLMRAIRALHRSRTFEQSCRHAGSVRQIDCDHPTAWVLETTAPCLALIGILGPRVLISTGVVNALSPEELSVVLSHESAHKGAFDNLKRLCFQLAPRSQTLERSWTLLSEYSADEQSVQGSCRRSMALASALVRVARLGAIKPMPSVATSFLGDESHLSGRVNRLLASPSAPEPSRRLSPVWGAAFVLVPLLFVFSTYRIVHSILELLLH